MFAAIIERFLSKIRRKTLKEELQPQINPYDQIMEMAHEGYDPHAISRELSMPSDVVISVMAYGKAYEELFGHPEPR